jgi:hypothetical protein
VESKLGPLGTSATYWPIVPAPGDCEDGEFGGMNGRGNGSTRRKSAPTPICPPQIPLHQTRDWTRAAAVGSQRLYIRVTRFCFVCEVLAAVTSCSLVKCYWRFGGTYCLHPRCRKVCQGVNQLKASRLQFVPVCLALHSRRWSPYNTWWERKSSHRRSRWTHWTFILNSACPIRGVPSKLFLLTNK